MLVRIADVNKCKHEGNINITVNVSIRVNVSVSVEVKYA